MTVQKPPLFPGDYSVIYEVKFKDMVSKLLLLKQMTTMCDVFKDDLPPNSDPPHEVEYVHSQGTSLKRWLKKSLFKITLTYMRSDN